MRKGEGLAFDPLPIWVIVAGAEKRILDVCSVAVAKEDLSILASPLPGIVLGICRISTLSLSSEWIVGLTGHHSVSVPIYALAFGRSRRYSIS